MDSQGIQLRQQVTQALRRNRGQHASPTSLPAPVKGWNTIASLADMDPLEASSISNWYPSLGYVRVRKGYQRYAQGIGTGDVTTLAEYWAGTTHKLFGSSSTNIYDTIGNVANYAPNAVNFDGTTTYLTNASNLTGIAGGKTGSVSFWFRPGTSSNAEEDILSITFPSSVATTNRLVVYYLPLTGDFKVIGRNSSGATILQIATATHAYTSTSTYYNVLISWDLSASSTNIFINNVSDKTVTLVTNDTIDYAVSSGAFNVGHGSASNPFLLNGDISELYFNLNYIDFSVSGNRAKFIDSNGYPVSLGADGSTPTGAQPILYLSQPAASFQTNEGSGGNFTVTGSITNATSTPASAGLSVASGFTNGRWHTANFIGNLFWCNGSDTPQVYNGSAFSNWTGTGPTVTNVIGCNVYRNRLYVWEKNTQKVWYSATSTIGGAYTAFNLYDVGRFGGNLIGCATLTHDGGNGPDDYIVFVMSSGDVLVYSGDPGSTFSLVGVFKTAIPLDSRAIIKVGPDVLICTVEDYILLSQLMTANYTPSKISGDVKTVAAAYASNTGWQAIYWSKGSMILVNIPTSSTTFDQHVYNTVTQAWTKYTNIPARCWGSYNGDLYIGGTNGLVYKAETGTDDDGDSITADITQAFSSLNSQGQMLVRGYRPVLQAEGTLTYSSGMSYDYNPTPVTLTSTSLQSGPFWDQTLWDTSQWAGSSIMTKDWKTGFGRGYQVATRLRTLTTDLNVFWYRTDFLTEPGSPI